MTTHLDAALTALGRGDIVIIADDGGGADLMMAAEFASAERLAFFVRHTSGFVCTRGTTTGILLDLGVSGARLMADQDIDFSGNGLEVRPDTRWRNETLTVRTPTRNRRGVA